jgi:hypothetical protein
MNHGRKLTKFRAACNCENVVRKDQQEGEGGVAGGKYKILATNHIHTDGLDHVTSSNTVNMRTKA